MWLYFMRVSPNDPKTPLTADDLDTLTPKPQG